MASTGLPADPAFFSPPGCSHASSDRLFLERLTAFADQAALAEAATFKTRLAALRKLEWVVYAKAAFCRTRRCARLPVPLHPPDRYCQTAGSSPSTASAPHCQVTGRRLITLNDSGRSPRWGPTGKIAPLFGRSDYTRIIGRRATSAATILVRLSLRDGDAVPHAIAWMKKDPGTFGDTIKDFRLSVVAVANLDSGGARPPVADGEHLPIVALSEESPDRHG